jgi:hypothetical protein
LSPHPNSHAQSMVSLGWAGRKLKYWPSNISMREVQTDALVNIA